MHLNRHGIGILAPLEKSEIQAKWQAIAIPGKAAPSGHQHRPVIQAL
jgi:hypothetical protein